MSIAQFDATNAKNVAAQINAAATKTSHNGDFARLLSDSQLHAQSKLQSAQQAEDDRRTDAAQTNAADQRAAQAHPAGAAAKSATDKGTTDKSASTDDSDKTQDAHHASRRAAAANNDPSTDATTPVATTAPPVTPTVAPAATTAAAAGSTDGTNGDGTGTDGATDASATATTTASTQTAAATTAVEDPTVTDPALAALATLGLGRSAVPGAGTNVPPANGKAALANVSVTKAPAAVKLSALTTALPLDLGNNAEPAINPATVALNPAAASAAANVAAKTNAAPVDPNADAPAPIAFPADLGSALASAATATAAIDPTPVTIAAGTSQHSSLFAQGGTDTANDPTALTNPATPTTAGFATLNAGTTVSRAETASTPSQNGQTGQTPLQLPAEQLAIAINKNVGRDGSQNFTIRLSPEKLGSVEVQLKVDSKGKTTANFVVEHAETLGLLKQDSNQLLQSLQNAGVDTNGASLSFSLRDPNTGTAQNQSNGSQGRQTAGSANGILDGAEAVDQPTVASNRLYDLKA